jgi:hypothetical protein
MSRRIAIIDTLVVAGTSTLYMLAEASHVPKRWSFLVAGGIIVIYILYLKNRGTPSWRDLGFRTDNIRAGIVPIGAFTLVAGIGLIAWGLFRSSSLWSNKVLVLLVLYPAWAVVQQFLFQGLLHRGLMVLSRLPILQVAVVAATFAAVHYGNSILVRRTMRPFKKKYSNNSFQPVSPVSPAAALIFGFTVILLLFACYSAVAETGETEQVTQAISVLEKRIIPPEGTKKEDVDAVYGIPEECQESRGKDSAVNCHFYQLLPPIGKDEFRVYLYIMHRNGVVWRAGINHICVAKSRTRWTDPSEEEEIAREKLQVLADLKEIESKFNDKLKSAPWNKPKTPSQRVMPNEPANN